MEMSQFSPIAPLRLLPVSLLVSAPIVITLATTATPLAAAPDERKLFSFDDIFLLDSPQSLDVAPDLQSAWYARRWADPATRQLRHSLWRVEGNAANRKPAEPGEPDARQPVVSPDGKWVAFLSTRPFPDGTPACRPVPPYSDPATDLWLMPTSGGPAIPLAGPGKPYGRVFNDPFYANVSFSPDGKRLLFAADDGIDPRTPEEIANTVEIVREDQGEGYEGYRPAQIWIAELRDEPADVAASRVISLTHDDYWYGDPQWMPDGQSVVVHANRTNERESVRYSINQNYDLWRIDVPDGKLTQLTTGPGPEVYPRVSPDGRRIACRSVPRRGTHMDAFNLLVVELSGGGATSRMLFDHHGPDAETAPHLSPAVLPRDCWLTNTRLYFSGADGVRTKLQVVDVAAGPAALADSAPENHSEAHAKESAARSLLTPPGDEILQQRILGEQEVITWKSFDGQTIEGVFTRPAEPGLKPPYKLVLYPHGGPHGRSVPGFSYYVQVLAAQGYAVFQPNFRGSTGYGQRFLDADRHDFGGGDMRDILTGIDHLIAGGLVDPGRQFVFGSSYGGYMTTWLVGQTPRFRAAAALNAVTDLTMMWGLSDLPSWVEWEFGGRPWEVPHILRERSPLTYASRVTTPTLVINTTSDRRCPLAMGQAYYRALQKAGATTEMLIYSDEPHDLQQPIHQADMMRRIVAWFERHERGAEGVQ